MTLSNAKVLYKHFLEIGRKTEAEQLLKRYPELKKTQVLPPLTEADEGTKPKSATEKKEVKKSDKVRKG